MGKLAAVDMQKRQGENPPLRIAKSNLLRFAENSFLVDISRVIQQSLETDKFLYQCHYSL